MLDTVPAVSPTERLMIHLGAHKTASTHFNRLLRRNRAVTDRHSVAVPRKDAVRSLVTRRLNSGNLMLSGPVREDVIDALAQGARTLFISDENIIGTPARLVQGGVMYPAAAPRLRTALRLFGRGREVELLVAVRHPGDFAVSSWCEAMRSWGYFEFRDYVGPDPVRALRWMRLLRRLLSTGDRLRITVWTYENYPSLSRDLVGTVLGQGAPPVREVEAIVRPGLSARAVQEIRAICEGRPDTACQDTFEEILKRFPKSGAYPPPDPWTPEERARLDWQYAREKRRMARLPGVRFLG